ncbi:MAG TPA: dCTP deaminase [Humisphaera sp.]|jgi:dCTP deaminase|nr:dCTP deaminase [Humisphaera sp.]
MILANVSIHEAIDKGWIKIAPEPAPRHKTPGQECPYQTSSVDLHLGNEISYFREGLAISIDLRRGNFADLFGTNSERRTITNDQPYALMPGKLVLGKTLERVEFPIVEGQPCFAARIEGRSSYARAGLLVHFTAPTIHAGFSGTITLELINLGSIPILLYPGAPVCQLIIEQVHGTPFRNDSQFQNQTLAGGGKP